MSKHTPGPWRFIRQAGPQGHCFVAQVWRPNGESLAVVESTTDPAEATANARLIAAAPDLLEALRPFAALAKSGDDGTEAWDAMVSAARAAIAKAESR